MLPGFSTPRVLLMKPQNRSMSPTRSTAMRTASASVATPSTFRARLRAVTSTNNEVRFKVPRLANGDAAVPLEISPLFALDAEELAAKVDRTLEIQEPTYLAT